MNKPIFNRYLSFKNPQIQNKKNLSFDNFLKKENKNSYLNQFEIKLNSQSNKKEKKIFSNSKKSNNSNSPHLSIAFGKCYNSSNSEKNNSINSLQKKSFTSAKKINFLSFANANEKISKMSFLGKKKKILSSEEIELEKIKKEKEEIKKQKLINEKCYQRSKNYIPITITPSPLTILKPFHLSSSRSSKFLKNRMSSTDYEINKINNKIKEKIKKKCEEFHEKGNKNIYMNKSFDYGLFYTETKKENNNFKTTFPSKILEKFYKNITIPLNEDNSNNILNNNKINNLSLSSRIKQYYNTTKKVLDTENKKKE